LLFLPSTTTTTHAHHHHLPTPTYFSINSHELSANRKGNQHQQQQRPPTKGLATFRIRYLNFRSLKCLLKISTKEELVDQVHIVTIIYKIGKRKLQVTEKKFAFAFVEQNSKVVVLSCFNYYLNKQHNRSMNNSF